MPPRRSAAVLAACALGLLLTLPAVGRGDEGPASPFPGPDGEVRAVFGPEFQSSVDLLEDLATFGIEGLDAQLIGPLVPAPKEGQPPVPSRLLLRGPPEVVAQAREVLSFLDVPRPAVAVSVLAAEVLTTCDRERGGSLLFDRNSVDGAPDSLFRGAFGSYEPESYLRSSLTQTIPFHGTSLTFGNASSDWTRHGIFQLVIRMLHTERLAEILAWPTVVCTEGEPGIIENIVTRPDRVFRVSGSGLLVGAIPVTGGIVLTVIPVRVSRAGAVLDVVADIGLLLPEDPANVPAANWRVAQRKVATRVTVRDRESILIGGVRLKRQVSQTVGDPVFGRIPGADLIASSSNADYVESEMILVLSVRVLVPGSRVGVTLPPGEARRLQREANRAPGRLGER